MDPGLCLLSFCIVTLPFEICCEGDRNQGPWVRKPIPYGNAYSALKLNHWSRYSAIRYGRVPPGESSGVSCCESIISRMEEGWLTSPDGARSLAAGSRPCFSGPGTFFHRFHLPGSEIRKSRNGNIL